MGQVMPYSPITLVGLEPRTMHIWCMNSTFPMSLVSAGQAVALNRVSHACGCLISSDRN